MQDAARKIGRTLLATRESAHPGKIMGIRKGIRKVAE
jgi:ribosomal protein S14